MARGVLGGVLATDDGFPLAARLRCAQDEEALAGGAAAMGRLVSSVLARLGRGELDLAVLDASKLRFLVRRLSVGFFLVVAEPEANVGLIAAEMNRAAATLEDAVAALAGP